MEDESGPAVVRGRERAAEVDALAALAGGRAGLGGVLEGLDREADRLDTSGSAAAYAFAWDGEDQRSRRWWPQGVTSSADADPSEEYAGRRVLVTSAYSKVVDEVGMGSRVTVADLGDPDRVRYAHVLLVVVSLDEDGSVSVRPLRVHAGGLVWHGPHLHVAATARGFFTCRVDDVVPAGALDRPLDLGPLPDGRLAGHGHRWLLPVRYAHASQTAEGQEPFRYSFLSLARHSGGLRLRAGEYGRGSMTTRLLGYDLDPVTGLPATSDGRTSRAVAVETGVPRMQGVVEVAGRLYVTTSAGPRRRGSVWTGPPGRLVEHRKVLPAGPEDLAHWPSEDRLWTVTEYPRRRVVLALDRARFGVA